MGFLSMFWGDPERKRREKQQKDSEQDYLRHKRIIDERQATPKRLPVLVKRKGKAFSYRSLKATNPNAFFNFGNKKKSKGKRNKHNKKEFSLI
jgi:hypothetical protein